MTAKRVTSKQVIAKLRKRFPDKYICIGVEDIYFGYADKRIERHHKIYVEDVANTYGIHCTSWAEALKHFNRILNQKGLEPV